MCVQELKESDYPKQFDSAARMQVLLHDEPDALIFMGDEAHFYLNGTVNNKIADTGLMKTQDTFMRNLSIRLV